MLQSHPSTVVLFLTFDSNVTKSILTQLRTLRVRSAQEAIILKELLYRNCAMATSLFLISPLTTYFSRSARPFKYSLLNETYLKLLNQEFKNLLY